MTEFQNGGRCGRCGTCCRKGGPALHLEDRALVEGGGLALRYLVTLRRGEPVHDNVAGGVIPAPTDIIKIKGRTGTTTCHFFRESDPAGGACAIYDHRPLECRLLACSDTRAIEGAYGRERLTRRDLIARVEGLWDLVEDHQRRCDPAEAVRRVRGGGPAERSELGEMVAYDRHLRALLQEKGAVKAEVLPFLLGRPLAEVVGVLIRKPLEIWSENRYEKDQ